MKNIIFIAPPAAGKGTQSRMVHQKYGIPHISMGDILRDLSKEDSELGHYIAEILSTGGLVKDEITYQAIEQRLKKDDCKNGYILDGFPRRIEQAQEYDKILEKLGYDIGNVILIDVDEDRLEKRVTGRRVCENCDAIYNINDPKYLPKVESTCDKCGGKLYQRTDDNLEAFQNRHRVYVEQTEPIIDYYRKKGVLHVVSGNDTRENIFKQIDEIISEDK